MRIFSINCKNFALLILVFEVLTNLLRLSKLFKFFTVFLPNSSYQPLLVLYVGAPMEIHNAPVFPLLLPGPLGRWEHVPSKSIIIQEENTPNRLPNLIFARMKFT